MLQIRWVASLSGVTDDYKNKFLPLYYNVIAKYYSENEGPYLLGDRITYADFAVYQSIDNDERIGALPVSYSLCTVMLVIPLPLTYEIQALLPEPVQRFREAFEARPNIATYIEETRAKKT